MENIKFVPMLFSTPMVQAILRGEKNQTRRIVTHNSYNVDKFEFFRKIWNNGKDNFIANTHENSDTAISVNVKPKCNIGDIVWVRETYLDGEDYSCVEEDEPRFSYKADCPEDQYGDYTWKPSIHMPKAACRIFLKITDVRAECLKEISEEDAIGEGITWKRGQCQCGYGVGNRTTYNDPINAFKALWLSINGNDSWNKNPWVFVYKFEKLEGVPEGFLNW